MSHPTERIELKLNTLNILLVDRKLNNDVVLNTLSPLAALRMLMKESVENNDSVDRREQKLHIDSTERYDLYEAQLRETSCVSKLDWGCA